MESHAPWITLPLRDRVCGYELVHAHLYRDSPPVSRHKDWITTIIRMQILLSLRGTRLTSTLPHRSRLPCSRPVSAHLASWS